MKRCTRCHAMKLLDGFNRRAASTDGLRSECRDCQKIAHMERRNSPGFRKQRREAAARRRAAHPDKHRQEAARRRERKGDSLRAENRAYVQAAQAESLPRATNYRKQWTGPELETASREDLTTRQVAAMLGRTYAGVTAMRHRLKVDPIPARLAGIPLGDVAAP